MKIRQGFVSNSSSSSFCIMGDTIKQPDHIDDFHYEMEQSGLECYDMYGEYAVGLGLNKMRDDETKGAFKIRVAELIFKLTGVKASPHIMAEEYEC